MSSWLNENKIKILKKSSQFPDLKSVDYMWKQLKYKVHDREATNMTDLIKFRKEKKCYKFLLNIAKLLWWITKTGWAKEHATKNSLDSTPYLIFCYFLYCLQIEQILLELPSFWYCISFQFACFVDFSVLKSK